MPNSVARGHEKMYMKLMITDWQQTHLETWRIWKLASFLYSAKVDRSVAIKTAEHNTSGRHRAYKWGMQGYRSKGVRSI